MDVNKEMLEALKQVLPIITRRWRSLPADSHEKKTMAKIRTTIKNAEKTRG